MNTKTAMSFIAYALTFALSLIAMHVMLIFDLWYWTGVIIAIVVFVFTLLSMLAFKLCKPLLFKRSVRPLSITVGIINAVADGIAASSLFMYLGYAPTIIQSAVCFAVMCALFIIYCLIARIGAVSHHPVIYTLCFVAVTLTALILFTVYCPGYRGVAVLALLFYVIFLAYTVSTAIDAHDKTEHFKTLAYCSFTALAVVIVIVLVVLSEGDFDLPLDGVGSSTANGKRNHYTFIQS